MIDWAQRAPGLFLLCAVLAFSRSLALLCLGAIGWQEGRQKFSYAASTEGGVRSTL